MSTPVVPVRRPLADLEHDQLRYAVVNGRQVSRATSFRRPRVLKPRWEDGNSSPRSNTRYAGAALQPSGRSNCGPVPSVIPHRSIAERSQGWVDRIRRRVIAVVSSPGGIIISTTSIFLSLSLAPVVSDAPSETPDLAPAQIAQMR